MRTQEQVNEIVRLLMEEYPLADCTLDWNKAYELLFSVRLAAQCTDERVNKVTPALYARFPTLEALAEAGILDSPETWAGRFGRDMTVGEAVGIMGKLLAWMRTAGENPAG